MKKTIKKLILFFSIIFSISTSVIAQERENKKPENKEMGKIIFIRSTGFVIYDASFKTFIDNKLICKLNNKKYSIHEVPVGKHECSVQFAGKKSKEKADKFEVEVEPGKINYIRIVLKTGFFANTIYCEEITEKSAEKEMKKMEEDTKCL